MWLVLCAVVVCSLKQVGCEFACGNHKPNKALFRNGYENVRIWIDPEVPETPEILNQLKQLVITTSQTLHNATFEKAWFSEVKIIIPSTWQHNRTYERANVTDIEPDNADFKFTNTDNPEPIVNRGSLCKEEGHNVEFGTKMLDNPLSLKARLLTMAWAEYRYGIFPERFDETVEVSSEINFPFDVNDCADPNNLTPTPNTCARLDLRSSSFEYHTSNIDGPPCNPCEEIDFDQIQLPECHKLKITHLSTKVQSSISSFPSEPQVFRFCNNDTHSKNAENLQNSKCSKKSAMEVIKADCDFDFDSQTIQSSKTNHQRNAEPVVRFVQSTIPSAFSLVIDVSGSMDQDDPKRISITQRAISGFMKCANGKEVTIVEFSHDINQMPTHPDARLVLNLQKVDKFTRRNISNYIETLFARYLESTPIGAGILKGVEALENKCYGSKMIILSDGDENVSPYVDDDVVQNAVDQCDLIVDGVLISQMASEAVIRLASQHNGKNYIIDPFNDPNWQEALKNMIDAMCSSAVSAEQASKTQRLETTTVTVSAGGIKSGSVYIDSQLGDNTLFLFSNQNEKTQVHATVCSPSGQCMSSTQSEVPSANYEETRFDAAVFVEKAEPGRWRYDLSTTSQSRARRQAMESKVAVLVNSEVREGAREAITLEGWYSTENVTDVKKNPLVVYGLVKQGSRPVLNASVNTTFITAGGDTVRVILKDNGKGADYKANDGLYTAYFTRYDYNGYYSAETIATDNIGRAKVAIKAANGTVSYVNTDSFQRSHNNGIFVVTDKELDKHPGMDIIPPGRVTDMAALSPSLVAKTVKLQWTAPGDDMDSGTATSYYIAYAPSDEQLINDFFACDHIRESIRPLPAGSTQTETVSVARASFPIVDNTIVYFALIAYDEAGNKGDVSNVARSNFYEVRTTTTTKITTEEPTTTKKPTTTTQKTTTTTEEPTTTTTTTEEPTTTTTTTKKPTTTIEKTTTTATEEPTTTTTTTEEPTTTTTTTTKKPTTTTATTTTTKTTTTTTATTTKKPTTATTKKPTTTTATTAKEPTTRHTSTRKPFTTTTEFGDVCGGRNFCRSHLDGNYADPFHPCSAYFCACSGGSLYIMNCPQNLIFNEETDSCQPCKLIPACASSCT